VLADEQGVDAYFGKYSHEQFHVRAASGYFYPIFETVVRGCEGTDTTLTFT
jgi:hypothetical protein